ncbi:MAG: DNA mismatch repair endonuclease MutL [Polyangiales bacterium]
MTRIALLPPDVANQIAAGEVVERPASVVKELVENALDAGAQSVTVTLDGGGLARISVTDDGSGMGPDDLRLAVVRHATSKIRSADDLVGVSTYGFRGEALPSIASVSRFRVTSRARGSDEGAEVAVEGGADATLRPAGCPVGTTVSVEDLFFNTPARRKFMRSPQTEGAACVEAVVRMAIPRPDVRFAVRRDGRVVRELLRHPDVAARVREVWPDENLADLRGSRGPVKVTALLGPPERARAGANHLALYVNGRHVRDRVLLRAVAQAYGSTLEGGRYPVGALLLEVPPEEVDVNVHPQKTEVRFASQGAVFEAVAAVLRDAAGPAPWAQASLRPRDFWAEHLATGPAVENKAAALIARAEAEESAPPAPATSPAPAATEPASPSAPPAVTHAFVEAPADPADPWARILQAPYPPKPYDLPARGAPTAAPAPPAPAPSSASEQLPGGGAFGALRYVGQLRRMYLLCENETGVVILDQHAAAERVTFERLRKAYAARAVAMQPMLVPERVELPPEDVALVEERADDLASVGMDLAPIGPTTVAVRAVPALLLRADPRRLARDLVSELARQGNDFSRARDLVLATMACHGSVRGGDALADDEARALLLALDAVDFGGHCPHGRPVVWTVRWSELERKVGR